MNHWKFPSLLTKFIPLVLGACLLAVVALLVAPAQAAQADAFVTNTNESMIVVTAGAPERKIYLPLVLRR